MLNPPTQGSRILSSPFKTVGGPYAPLRILLPCLQEILRQDSVSRGLRGRRGAVPALRQQERRAALVRLLRHHLEEERLRTKSAALHQKRSLTPVPSGPSLKMSHWPQPKLCRILLRSGPAAVLTREKIRALEIHQDVTVVSDDGLGPNDGGQAVGRETHSAKVTPPQPVSFDRRSLERPLFRTSAKGVFPCLHELSKSHPNQERHENSPTSSMTKYCRS